jgi:ribosomal protein L29
MDDKKLAAHLAGLEKDLLAARKALADGSLPNPRVISKAKKSIAQAKTILNEKAKAASRAAAEEAKPEKGEK